MTTNDDPYVKNHKSVAIDMTTYNILAKAAEQECRTIAMQIKWLVRNSNDGSPKPAEVPIISEVVKRRKKRVGKKSMKAITTNPETQLNRCLLKFASGLTLCSKDFEDILGKGRDASGDLYALSKRGDIKRIGNSQPYYYQLTPVGATRIKDIQARLEG